MSLNMLCCHLAPTLTCVQKSGVAVPVTCVSPVCLHTDVTALLQSHNIQGSAQLSKAKSCFLEHDKIYLTRSSARLSFMFSKAAFSGNTHTLTSCPPSAPSYPSSAVAVEEAADWRVDASGAAGAVLGWGQYRSMTRRVPPPCRVPTWGLRVRSDPGGALNSKV